MRILVSVIVLLVVTATCPLAVGQFTPLEWYEPSPLDANMNKLDDRLDQLPAGLQPEVFICFKNDCRPDSLVQMLLDMGAEVGYSSPIVASLAVRGLTRALLQNPVATWPEVGWIVPNDTVSYYLSVAGQACKAHAGFYSPNTAEDAGYDGAGITIGIIDSGVRDSGNPGGHPDLPVALGGIVVTDLFTGAIAVGNPTDDQGHGTMVAGVALGRGNAGANRGIAPAANLFDCRVADATGSMTTISIQAAVDWLTLNGASITPRIRVVNLSIGNDAQASGGDPITASIQALIASGVVVCAAVGNHDNCATTAFGSTAGIGNVAIAPNAITVAAATHSGTADRSDDVYSNYSRRGPGLGSDPKPNITAHSRQCTAACPSNCVSGTLQFNIITTTRTGGYAGFGGTSCATPMVSGAAALVLEQNGSLSPAAVKLLLTSMAEDRGAPGWDPEWGSGLLDLGPIFSAIPLTCDLQVQKVIYNPIPADCNQPVTVTVTVFNSGTVPVTNFEVRMQYWYFGPGAPAVRYDLTTAPILNTSGPLVPGASRDFQGTFNLKLLTTPLSQHTCFWGIVDAACDNVPSNNERNINATIANLQGTQCKLSGRTDNIGDTMVVRMRLAHQIKFNIPVTVFLNNPDPLNWYLELVHEGIRGSSLDIDVNPSGCPTDVDVYAFARNPGISDSIDALVFSFNENYGNFGDARITFLARLAEYLCGDADGSGTVTISDAVLLINYIFAGGTPPIPLLAGDANCDNVVTISDAVYLINYIFGGGAAPCTACL